MTQPERRVVAGGRRHQVAARVAGLHSVEVREEAGRGRVARQQGQDPLDHHAGIVGARIAHGQILRPLHGVQHVPERRGGRRHGGVGQEILQGQHRFGDLRWWRRRVHGRTAIPRRLAAVPAIGQAGRPRAAVGAGARAQAAQIEERVGAPQQEERTAPRRGAIHRHAHQLAAAQQPAGGLPQGSPQLGVVVVRSRRVEPLSRGRAEAVHGDLCQQLSDGATSFFARPISGLD